MWARRRSRSIAVAAVAGERHAEGAQDADEVPLKSGVPPVLVERDRVARIARDHVGGAGDGAADRAESVTWSDHPGPALPRVPVAGQVDPEVIAQDQDVIPPGNDDPCAV